MTGKVAAVTGAASGIGLAITGALLEDGNDVVFIDVQPPDKDVLQGGCFLVADLSVRDQCKTVMDEIVRRYGRIDILINNAGVQHVSPIEDFPEDRWDYIIKLMLTAPFLLTKYAWPHMRKNNWGRIININSVHGLRASEYKCAYVSAKHGISGLTKVSAIEGAKYNITVNSICPGYVQTPLVENQIAAQAKAHNMPEAEVIEEIMLKKASIKRLIKPDEVAAFVRYLCSEAAGCITGSMLSIDGGWTAS